MIEALTPFSRTSCIKMYKTSLDPGSFVEQLINRHTKKIQYKEPKVKAKMVLTYRMDYRKQFLNQFLDYCYQRILAE